MVNGLTILGLTTSLSALLAVAFPGRQAMAENRTGSFPSFPSIRTFGRPDPGARFPLSGAGASVFPPSRHYRSFLITAYCPCRLCCGPSARGITASGRSAVGCLCAADRSIPFGAALEIPGYGRATVADRGGAIVGNRLDVLFSSHARARAWGARRLRVEVFCNDKNDLAAGRKCQRNDYARYRRMRCRR